MCKTPHREGCRLLPRLGETLPLRYPHADRRERVCIMGVGGQELCTFSVYEHIWHIYSVTVTRRVAPRALCGLMPGSAFVVHAGSPPQGADVCATCWAAAPDSVQRLV